MKYPFHHHASTRIFRNAKDLRRNQTLAEQLLWERLRNRMLMGKKFRRQHPISGFIVDFYCHESLLVVEVDGDIHRLNDNPEYDYERTKCLEALGLCIIRFSNQQVFQEINGVVTSISKHLK